MCAAVPAHTRVHPCCTRQPPPLKTSHLSKFQLETLFYIFYAMPRDVLQAYAAQELYQRDWQYHRDLKVGAVSLCFKYFFFFLPHHLRAFSSSRHSRRPQ